MVDGVEFFQEMFFVFLFEFVPYFEEHVLMVEGDHPADGGHVEQIDVVFYLNMLLRTQKALAAVSIFWMVDYLSNFIFSGTTNRYPLYSIMWLSNSTDGLVPEEHSDCIPIL